jgi:hypothetical protein
MRGLDPRHEHAFTWIGVIVVLLYATTWIDTIKRLHDSMQKQGNAAAPVVAVAPPKPVGVGPISNAILAPNPTATTFLTDAMMRFTNPLHGNSGKVYFTVRAAGDPIVASKPGDIVAVLKSDDGEQVSPDFAAPSRPGIYSLAVRSNDTTRTVDNLNVITLVPFAKKSNGRIGSYLLGSWPFERGGQPRSPAYANPVGFIEVTQQNQNTYVSEHFRLRDFLTKTQFDVWPKYILLSPKLLDKLELTIMELQEMGHPVKTVHIMSGFRTPNYNVSGGNTQGRAGLSRHMYGDASDIFVDNDGNGVEDDLNRNGRSDPGDAEVVAQAADRVEKKYPSLVGGVGVYSACCGHGPFTHIDCRGNRARWRGTGNG